MTGLHKYHQRQLADRSSAFYMKTLEAFNPANGSWRIVQVLPIHLNRFREVSGYRMNSTGLNDPPTAVGGIIF
jgi:hypothetical protein